MAIDWSQVSQNLAAVPGNPLFQLGIGLMANGGAAPYGTTLGQRFAGALGYMGNAQARMQQMQYVQQQRAEAEQGRQDMQARKQKLNDALQNSPYADNQAFQALAAANPEAAASYALKQQQQDKLTSALLGAPGQPGFTPPATPTAQPGVLPASLPQETQDYVTKIKAAAGNAPLFDALGQPTAALLDAQKQVESGGNNNAVSSAGAQGPYQFMPATAASVGLQNPFDPVAARNAAATYDSQLYRQFGGNPALALAAYNAGPGTLQKAMQAGAPAPTATTTASATPQNALLANPAFRALAAADPAAALKLQIEQAGKQSVGRYQTMSADQVAAAGLPQGTTAQMAPNGQIHVLNKGSALPDEQTFSQLSPQDQALVKKVAAYEVLPSNLSNYVRPGQGLNRQQILGYAAVINPDYNINNAEAANTYLKDMAKSSPTSIGGQVQSLNQVLHHLHEMVGASPGLPGSGVTSLNAAENYFNSHFRGNSPAGVAVGNWDQGKVFINQELGKLLKGGVASEAEVKALEDKMDAAASLQQRHQALYNVASYVDGKITALTDRRDKLLGNMAPKTSLLDAQSQKSLRDAYALQGQDAPDMLPPGTSYATGATAQSATANKPSVPSAALMYLKAHPDTRAQFDAQFGAGAAAQALGN